MLGLHAKWTRSWKRRMCGTGILRRKLFGAIIRGSSLEDVWRGIVLDSPKSAVLWWLGRRRHFTSRDKNGGHTITSAISENPLLDANFTALTSIKPEFIADFFTLCEFRISRIFEKNSEKILNFILIPQTWCRRCWSTFSDPLPTVLACVLPELHACEK